ncbi:MAG: adenylate/guanylate cyclase domain-containing protein, partial [Ardenticatenales bacterium]|nr:adenylate/guanylate cyclase domain-containing protein [Ardenticatenales bacterium]
MPNSPPVSLVAMEARLRELLPAALYATAWTNPSPETLTQVFEHLRTLQYILLDYVPRHISTPLTEPGAVEFEWEQGTLMFTDLAGFTRLLEANVVQGGPGAEMVLSVLNGYFAGMIEIISKSSGSLLEFTGDAMLVQFRADRQRNDCAKAIRSGLRMQRAMAKFTHIETPQGNLSLGMRIGIHTGRFLTAHIGTPKRMEHVLLGSAVQRSKRAEGAGTVGRVCVTETIATELAEQFRFEAGPPGYMLVMDDFSEEELGEYEIVASRNRKGHTILFDRSVPGLIHEIGETLKKVEPLASYLPSSILTLLVESASRREIQPEFVDLVAMFVNILGLSERIEELPPEEQVNVVVYFSRLFARINAAVLEQGGV